MTKVYFKNEQSKSDSLCLSRRYCRRGAVALRRGRKFGAVNGNPK